MQIAHSHSATRVIQHYTARHRHHLPVGGFTAWSEGIANGRHTHGLSGSDGFAQVADSVGSPVHRHAWTLHRRGRKEQGFTSGPLIERPLQPAIQWLQRVFSH
jgi:hypothetical protein